MNQKTLPQVMKRDGRTVPFDIDKIEKDAGIVILETELETCGNMLPSKPEELDS